MAILFFIPSYYYMRSLTLCTVASATLALLCYCISANQTPPPAQKPKFSKEQRIDKAIEQEFEKTKDPKLNTVPRERLKDARKIASQKLALKNAVSSLNWQERGPDNVGGRTRAILFDQNDPTQNTVFAAGVSGGLWKTTNIKSTNPNWKAINDFFENIAITCIIQDPANSAIMYFGTGEGWFNSDAVKGMGIWKTTDKGNTWTQLQSTDNQFFTYVQDMEIDQNGNLYASTLVGGVQRSADRGNTWQQVVGFSVGAGNDNRAADLEIAANGTIYATLGIRSSGAIFKSASGDRNTWQNITPSGTFQRIEIACAPTDANRIYALCQGSNSNDVTDIYRSDNGGSTWITLPVPKIVNQSSPEVFTRGQGWYNLIAAVDPNNANVICIGGVDALRSTDAGNTWEQITTWSLHSASDFTAAQNIHGDHHAIVYAPGNSSTALWGTDGGLYYTTDLNNFNKKPNFTPKNKGYNVTQFYSCAIHPNSSVNYFLGGTQDNATRQFTTAGLDNTTTVGGGDGGFCHINQKDPNIQIISYLYNNYYVSIDGGNTFAGKFFGHTGKFINPTDYDDNIDKLYASDNSNKYLRWNDPAKAGNSRDEVTVSEFKGASPTSVLVSPNVNNRVYFGLNNGSVVRVDNAHSGTSHTGLIVRERGIGSVVCVEVEKGNEDHALAIYSNYGVESIWETLDGGTSWRSCQGDLPDMPVRWAMFAPDNPDQVLIATELGIWQTADLNGTATVWIPASEGLANVRVDMLQYRPSDDLIIAATHGRGMFSATYTLIQPPHECPTNFAQAGTDISICQNDNTQLNASGGQTYQWSPSADLSCINCSNPLASPPVTRTYTVTVTDEDNCTDADDIIIYVNPCPTAECLNVSDIYQEDFETHTICQTTSECLVTCPLSNDWINETNDDTDWRTDSGGTASSSTGPSTDFAPGTTTGKYLYLESSSCYNSTARLTSPCFDLTAMNSPQLSFAYHAYGGGIGDLHIRMSTDADSIWSQNTLIASGNQSDIWKEYTTDLPASDQVKIQIIGTTGGNYRGDLAIDNIIIKNKNTPQCPTNFAEAGQNIADCANVVRQLNASGGISYQWSPTTGLSNPNIANPNLTLSSNKTYTVTVTDADGCADTDQVTVTTYANPTAYAGTDKTICKGDNVALNASGGTTYLWSPNYALTNANSSNPIANPSITTTYTVIATNSTGCTDTDQITITVKDCDGGNDCTKVTISTPYQENFDSFDLCSTSCSAICELGNDWLNETTDETDWLTNTSNTKSGGTGPTADYNTGTDGRYLYVESTSCYNKDAVLTSPCFDLSSLNLPELRFAYHMFGTSMGDMFISISDNGGSTWSDSSLIASGEQGDTWQTTKLGLPKTDAVMFRFIGMTKGHFRSDMAIDDIRIQDGSNVPLAPSEEGDIAMDIKVHSNPANEHFVIVLESYRDLSGQLALYDLTGRNVWSENIQIPEGIPQRRNIQVSAYPAGLYVLVFKNSSLYYTEKVIIR